MKNYKLAALALAAAAWLSPAGAAAATYYVAPSGSNSNPGTAASPFLTLQAGVNAARPGDTIVVRDGTYGPTGGAGSFGVTINRAGTSAAWITLRAENAGKAILDCQKVCQAYINLPTSAASYWVIQGFDIRNTTRFGIVAYPSGSGNVRITGNRIHHIGNVYDSSSQGIAGIYTDTNRNYTVDGNVIHDVGRTAVLTYSHDHGIYTHGVDMLISNNVFHTMFNGWHIQTAAGFSGTIVNNTFFGPNAGSSKNGQIVLWDQNGNVIVRNNLFYNPTRAAMTNVSARMSGTCRFENNLAFSPRGSVTMIDSTPSGCTQSANRLNVDPKLTSPALPNWDFHLQPGSPAIDAGMTVAQVGADFDGKTRPLGAAFDIGAFESGASAPGAPPVISAVSASGVGSTGAAIAWTTDKPADTQVAYGPTTAYGSATTLDTTLTTSHSAALGGLTPGTLYHYSVRSKDAGGASASSPDATFTTSGAEPPPAPGCVSSAGTWKNAPVDPQTGPFTIEFDATPTMTNMDGLAGLANGAASGYTGVAAIVRFNNVGRIDARNGGAYAAAAAYPYAANMTYRVRMVVDLPNRTYDVYVKQGSNAEQLIGSRYAFRTEQASATRLDDLAVHAATGGLGVCGVTVKGGAAPVISGVSAGGIGSSGATVSWTTDKPADSQVAYGPTAAYGSATTVNPALTTSHSAALSGLTAGAVYHYSAKSKDAAGASASSPDRTFTTTTETTPPGCITSAGGWQNASIPAQTAAFTAEWDATPSAASIDGVAGLSAGTAASYSALAAAVRFNNAGRIDARNGGAYAAATSIPYSAGQTYRFRLVVNLPARTYSAYVRQGSGAEQLVGAGYAFRTEQATATKLAGVGAFSSAGSLRVCGATVSAAGPGGTPPVITAVSATGVGSSGATINWTTDKPADSQVVYGLTASYGSATVLNSAPTTSHSAVLTALSPGVLYHYSVRSKDSAGNLASSPDATFTTTAAGTPPACVTSAGTWQNASIPAQTAAFTAEWEATPSAANIDGVAGLSAGTASDYSALAAAVRFNNSGRIDARNGGAYAAAASIPYAAGQTYRFRLVVNVPARTYSAYVRQGTGAEQLVGSNYAFRSEQASAASLAGVAAFSSSGSLRICGATASP